MDNEIDCHQDDMLSSHCDLPYAPPPRPQLMFDCLHLRMLDLDYIKKASYHKNYVSIPVGQKLSNGVNKHSGEGGTQFFDHEAPLPRVKGMVEVDPVKSYPHLVWSPCKIWLLYVTSCGHL